MVFFQHLLRPNVMKSNRRDRNIQLLNKKFSPHMVTFLYLFYSIWKFQLRQTFETNIDIKVCEKFRAYVPLKGKSKERKH